MTSYRRDPAGERGALSGEYALLLAMLSVALVVAIALLTDAIVRAFDTAISIMP